MLQGKQVRGQGREKAGVGVGVEGAGKRMLTLLRVFPNSTSFGLLVFGRVWVFFGGGRGGLRLSLTY